MPADAWKPVPQPPCTEPCCTGGTFPAAAPEPEPSPGALRECGVIGCTHCEPVTAGGGDRLPFGHRKA
jgi:hypothetical protein